MSDYHIGFMGFGHMAQVIFSALDRAKIIPRSQVLFLRRDRAKMKENEQKFGITATGLPNLVEKSVLIFLCMRPQQAETALLELKGMGNLEGKKLITIIAGKPIAFYQKHLGQEIQMVRAMPNIASSVMEGMTILTYGPGVSSEFKSITHLLFSSLGQIAEVKEDLCDRTTAMAGSGPGFVFCLIEAMARFGEQGGLSYQEALKMAAQVFAGASQLILKGQMPTDLIAQIATPNGITQTGLDVMAKHEMEKQFHLVLEAAMRKSREFQK